MAQAPTFLYDKTFIYHLNSDNRIKVYDRISDDMGGFDLVEKDSNSDFTIKVDLTKTGFSITDFDSVCLLSASIPKSYYAIQEGQNTFTLKEEASRVGGNITYHNLEIEIPVGTYSASTFSTVLAEKLNDASIKKNVYTNYLYSVSLDLTTAKFTISVNFVGASFTTYAWGLSFGDHMYNRLGFDANKEYIKDSAVYPVPPFTLISKNVIDMSPESDLFIRSDIVSGGADANEDIFYDIQASNVPPYGRIQVIDSDPQQHTRVLNNTQDTYRFHLTDEYGNPINLNGLNWTATILFFKKSSIPQKIKDFISYIVEMF